MVYTSGSLSLAALEYFVNLDPDLLPPDLVAIPADIPDDLGMRQITAASPPRCSETFTCCTSGNAARPLVTLSVHDEQPQHDVLCARRDNLIQEH